jgi:hypothetical protein
MRARPRSGSRWLPSDLVVVVHLDFCAARGGVNGNEDSDLRGPDVGDRRGRSVYRDAHAIDYGGQIGAGEIGGGPTAGSGGEAASKDAGPGVGSERGLETRAVDGRGEGRRSLDAADQAVRFCRFAVRSGDARGEIEPAGIAASTAIAEEEAPQSRNGDRVSCGVLQSAELRTLVGSKALMVPSPKLPTSSTPPNWPNVAGAICIGQGELSAPCEIRWVSRLPDASNTST